MIGLMTDLAREFKLTALIVIRMIMRLNIDRITRHGRIYLDRRRKWLRRRLTYHPNKDKTPVFIAGSNRSGTQMVCRALGNSPYCWDYPEADFSIAFDSYYLRSDWLIRWLIARSPAPIVSFGSILDSQSVDDILSKYKGARAIWVYRCYEDAANSLRLAVHFASPT